MSEHDGSIEIRPDDKGRIDEIVGYGVLVHIERMDKGSWFIILTRPDQTGEAFWLNGNGNVEFTMNESRPAPTIGPNAMPWTLDSSFAAGRLAGVREAAEVIVSQIQPPYTGDRSNDFMLGWAQGANNTAERNHAAIIALASGKERP